MDEEELISKHLRNLEYLNLACKEVLPEAYYDTIAYHWFERIGPDKTEEYGVTAWQRLGAKGIAAQLSGCFYRWERMSGRGLVLSNAPMFNALVDSFGYSILLHCVVDAHPIYLGDPVLPAFDHESILSHLWFSEVPRYPGKMAAIALRMAYQMFARVIDG